MRISDWSSDVCSSDLPVFGCFRQNLAVERGNALLPCGAQSFPTAIAHHNRYAKLPQVIRQRQAPMSAPNDQYALPTGACDTEPTRDMTYAEPVRHNGSQDDAEGQGDQRPPVAIAQFPKA